jgi:hypothetical protein
MYIYGPYVESTHKTFKKRKEESRTFSIVFTLTDLFAPKYI